MTCHGPKPAPAPPGGHSASAENAPGATDCRTNIATLVAISAVVTGGMRRTWGCPAGTQGVVTEFVLCLRRSRRFQRSPAEPACRHRNQRGEKYQQGQNQ